VTAQPEYTHCKFCGAVIRPGRNRRREYCNAAHKQAAYNARKRGAQLVTVISDDNKVTVTA
jgi:hypothetical protein